MKLEKLVFTKDNGEIVEFTLDELKKLQQIMLTVFPNSISDTPQFIPIPYYPHPFPYCNPLDNQPPVITCNSNTGSDFRDMTDNVPYLMNYTPLAYMFAY